MDTDTQPAAPDALDWRGDARRTVTSLYEAHAVGLIRLGVVMLGDRAAAEDVVQEAFCGLYRRWKHLSSPGHAVPYLRSSVMNGCRSALRRRNRSAGRRPGAELETAESAESWAVLGEEHRDVLAALLRLPDRQREALVLRYYLELAEAEIAEAMGISAGTVKSTTSRALAALGRLLEESR